MTKIALKPEIKALWLEALRSDEYEQGTGSLNVDGKFCCLGVLCDVVVKNDVTPLFVSTLTTMDEKLMVVYDGAQATLPSTLARDIWTSDDEYNDGYCPHVSALGELNTPIEDYNYLTDLNDLAGYTFEEIADVIEEQF